MMLNNRPDIGGNFLLCLFRGEGHQIYNVIRQIRIHHTQIRPMYKQVDDKVYTEIPTNVSCF